MESAGEGRREGVSPDAAIDWMGARLFTCGRAVPTVPCERPGAEKRIMAWRRCPPSSRSVLGVIGLVTVLHTIWAVGGGSMRRSGGGDGDESTVAGLTLAGEYEVRASRAALRRV